MKYASPLISATLIKRYKRFLADVRLPNGEVVTAHCPNSGSMKGCWAPEVPCRVTHDDNPKRKLKYTLEQVQVNGSWIMVHTGRPNHVVAEAIAQGRVAELVGYPVLQREKPYGSEKSRIDILLLDGGDLPPGSPEKVVKKQRLKPADRAAYVEVKNVTLLEDGIAKFPDAVTTRGAKHLRELMEVVRQGHRGVLVFHVGRMDCDAVAPAATIDPVYAETLRKAHEAGVEILAYRCELSETHLQLTDAIPVLL